MRKILTILLVLLTVALQAQRQGRIWSGSFPPTTPPTNFSKNGDIWLDTTSNQSFMWNGSWRLAPVQYAGKKGDKGDTGANGVCPDCPPSGGTGVGFPVVYGKTAFPTNYTEYLNAIKGLANGSIRNITLFNDIAITSDYELPDTITGNQTKRIEINLNGYGLIDASPNGLKGLIRRRPEDQAEALNVMQSWAVHIYNGYLRGKGASTLTALDICATYNSNIHDLQLDNFKDGVVVRFALMSTIRNIMINGCTNIAVNIDRGDWPNVGTANAQSNHTLAEQIRVFNVAGAYAAFQVINASGTVLRQCISEGGTPKYHVFWNSLGSTVCKDGWLIAMHLESPSSIAGVKLMLASGYFVASGNFSQYDNVLYDVESSLGYPHMYVENVPWMTGGSKLKTTGTSVIWSFQEVAFDPVNSAIWVNAYKPYYWRQEGFNQSYFEKGNHLSTTAARMVGQPYADWDVEYSPTEVKVLKQGVLYASKKFTKEYDALNWYNQINTVDLNKGILPK